MKRSLQLLLVPIALACATNAASAATLAQWNFNSPVADANNATGVTTPSVGAGTASVIGGPTATFGNGDANGGSTDPNVGDDSGWQTTGYPAAQAGDLSAGTQYLVSTAGATNIKVSYDLRHSNTSSRYEALQYTLDGSTWTTLSIFSGAAGDTWFNRAGDLSAIPGANNNANFGIRIVAAFESTATPAGAPTYVASNPTGSYATSGTWRFDKITVTGDVVPEPASAALGMSSLLALATLRRRRRS